jgi:hypothetical protein
VTTVFGDGLFQQRHLAGPSLHDVRLQLTGLERDRGLSMRAAAAAAAVHP